MAGFLSRQRQKRPEIWVKIATSTDGYVAEKEGVQSWLTGQTARRFVHDLRSRCDGLISGIGTVLSDNPQLNIRLTGTDQPLDRFILDSRAQMAQRPDLKIWQTGHQGGIHIVCAPIADKQAKNWPVEAKFVELEQASSSGLNLDSLIQWLQEHAYNRILVEAGPRVVRSFFEAGLVDRLFWLTSPNKIGGGVMGFPSLDFAGLNAYNRVHHSWLGSDELSVWHKQQPAAKQTDK